MVLGFQLQFPKFGWYRFSLNVDKVFLADWAVEVVKTEGGRK